MESRDFGIYLHLPFCPYICPYCDFAKEPWRASREERYFRALELDLARSANAAATTIFVGGGTPNMTAPTRVAALVQAVRNRFTLPPEAEITVEVNPDPARRFGFEHYAAAGVTRLSIGVQSFVPAELAALGRQHTAADVTAIVNAAHAAGIENLSLDLIFAVPGQTVASLRTSLDAALALSVDHISVYGLTIEENTPFAARFAAEPDYFVSDDDAADLYEFAGEYLQKAGFEHYEISNFARPGKRSRHNGNYWDNGEYLGFGVGAASFLNGRRWQNGSSIDAYCQALEAEAAIPLSSEERLSGAARVGEAVMLGLRRREGIHLDAFAERYGVMLLEEYAREIREYTEAGWLGVEARTLRLTARGRPVANTICAAFLRLPEAV